VITKLLVASQDSHGQDTSGAPVADPDQDCVLVGGRQNDTHTVARFLRALDTCDSDHDFVLGGDTVRVIWAVQDSDPTLDGGELVGMTWHGKERRGVRSLHMLNPPVKRGAPRGPQAQHWDVTLKNFTVPDNMDTLYWCKIFRVPPLERKHHMIGYEPVLQPGNERFVHHMLLYECVLPHNLKSPDAIFQRYVDHPGESCYSATMPQAWDQCMTAIVAWAVGSQGEFLPDHVGLPLSDGDKAKYFMLEIHYDNPEFRRVRDSSGVRIHYTENLRQYDGGILVNGITITPLHIVPPHQPEYRTAGYCSSQCTNQVSQLNDVCNTGNIDKSRLPWSSGNKSLPSKETLRGHSDSSFRGEGYIQCCVGVRLCDMYSNQELAEIHFMYGKADGNAALARRLYQERYPQRQCPDRKTFALSPADYPARVRFCQWFLQQCGVNPNFPALVLFTDEAQFTRDGITNFHNQHVWAYKNPRATVPSHHQVRFSLNMRQMFPKTGIKLVSVVLHSHLAGKKLRLRHIRNGRELPRVAEDDHYDFNYQQARVLPKEVAVLPGDELVTECVYQTPNRTEPTFGGYSTKQEMCLAFVLYYPRTPLAACYSMTPVKYFFETFGVRQFYDVDMDTVERMFLKLPLSDNK
ncbi:hypothetical protein ANN_09572, partial [Periplaneta americana]